MPNYSNALRPRGQASLTLGHWMMMIKNHLGHCNRNSFCFSGSVVGIAEVFFTCSHLVFGITGPESLRLQLFERLRPHAHCIGATSVP